MSERERRDHQGDGGEWVGVKMLPMARLPLLSGRERSGGRARGNSSDAEGQPGGFPFHVTSYNSID